MKNIVTTLKNRHDIEVTSEGTGAIVITSTRDDEGINVDFSMDVTTPEECISMVAMLLTHLEGTQGEHFVARCLAAYADATGKPIKEVGGQDIVTIGGGQASPARLRCVD